LKKPDHTTAGVGVDDGCDRVRGVVEAVDELEPERDQQGDAEQDVRKGATFAHHGKVDRQMVAGVDHADDEHHARKHVEPRV
jgi:hypothetical protein